MLTGSWLIGRRLAVGKTVASWQLAQVPSAARSPTGRQRPVGSTASWPVGRQRPVVHTAVSWQSVQRPSAGSWSNYRQRPARQSGGYPPIGQPAVSGPLANRWGTTDWPTGRQRPVRQSVGTHRLANRPSAAGTGRQLPVDPSAVNGPSAKRSPTGKRRVLSEQKWHCRDSKPGPSDFKPSVPPLSQACCGSPSLFVSAVHS